MTTHCGFSYSLQPTDFLSIVRQKLPYSDRPCFQVAKWNPHEYPLEQYVRYVGFFMAQSERRMAEAGATEHVVLFDMAGWAMWHGRYMSYIKQLVGIAQDQYPERLGRAVLLHVPTLFKAAWAVISKFIDARTEAKVHFIDDKDLAAELGTLLPADAIPLAYGGAREGDVPVPNAEGW